MRLRDLAGRRVVIWGAAREATSVVEALQRFEIEADLSIVDDSPEGPENIAGVDVLRGPARQAALDAADVIVRSPAVSIYRDDVVALRQRGVQFTSATQLWFAEGLTNVIAITGTKGKSTTASLTAHLLEAAGLSVALAGNIGRAPIDLLGTEEPDWWVVELSSYQTSDLTVSPAIGVLTSLSPEHLDWHHGEQNYFADKLNLFAHDPDAEVVVNCADAGARSVASSIDARLIRANEAPEARVQDGFFQVGDLLVAPTNAFQLLGHHNIELACVALTVLDIVGVDIERHGDAIAQALTTFEPLPHRLEVVGEVNGVTYVDDSISTTPAATIAALSAFEGHPVTVLVGGYDRGLSYEAFARYIKHAHGRVGVVALPDSSKRILDALDEQGCNTTFIAEARDLAEGVQMATETLDGGIVLLSPGAPSFGQFRNYIERGEVFRQAVRELRHES